MNALVENDLGARAALKGMLADARAHFERALRIDSGCAAARENLELLGRPLASGTREAFWAADSGTPTAPAAATQAPRPVRVAIVSLLFNWPSTGGGTVHTAELGKFLGRAGYEVRHIYAQYAGWGIGKVTADTGVASTALAFDGANWNAPEIQRRFRQAVDEFSADYVIVTDSWNFKPLLAEAMRGYRYFLRLAALECLCPLNNVRLLVDDRGNATACSRHQLASAHLCGDCVMRRQHQSGSLHQAERALAGYGTAEYDQKLRQAFAEAEGVLVVNPLIAAMVGPFARAVHVVPSGFDRERFPWPIGEADKVGGTLRVPSSAHGVCGLPTRNPVVAPAEAGTTSSRGCGRSPDRATIFFAGLVNEYMKGFHVLHAACAKLWQKRRDFELLATADPARQFDPMTRFVGWLSQEELPRQMREADFLVFPTIAEEALGRSAVEAMGAGRPVIASRIGGLPFTVADGATGLLFEPGNVDDLAAKIELLLDDPALRERMGQAARGRFEEHFTWETIIEKHYRRLLVVPPAARAVAQAPSLETGQSA